MSTQTIIFYDMPPEPDRLAVCEWLERHGIDHKRVPVPCTLTRHLLPEPPGITHDVYVVGEDGQLQLTPDRDSAVIEKRWVPMEANPLPFPDLARTSAPEEQQ